MAEAALASLSRQPEPPLDAHHFQNRATVAMLLHAAGETERAIGMVRQAADDLLSAVARGDTEILNKSAPSEVFEAAVALGQIDTADALLGAGPEDTDWGRSRWTFAAMAFAGKGEVERAAQARRNSGRYSEERIEDLLARERAEAPFRRALGEFKPLLGDPAADPQRLVAKASELWPSVRHADAELAVFRLILLQAPNPDVAFRFFDA